MNGKIIRAIRLKSLMTTREFATELGVTQATISAWENDKSAIRLKNQRKIKRFCEKNEIKFNENELDK